ncbi:Dynamin family/Root hair defective 3 GTP-binding protein (RHD3) [Novymonas esmeraldas]|uniref:Protein SEY1 homolog n=1 Tax=Novymonas esmeraldas TaxID=1808958 RepID=A0AAW0F303_9TRYP
MSLHLVDSDGHLQAEKKLTEYLATIVAPNTPQDRRAAPPGDGVLEAVGMNYHVVGVFGGQSSGKSTLLNRLFGTDFQMLDETVRRGQTTKGAFMARANSALAGFEDNSDHDGAAAAADVADRCSSGAADRSSRLNRAAAAATARDAAEGADASPTTKSPLLVLDFEGTDGLERGEDQSFERQLSLFGLSIADTLIINMWAVDVGRFNAANLSLLRTIFEVNLQLFSHDNYEAEEKPTLLIVLRDFTEDDPAPSLATVRKSFDTIWENITRPAQFEGASIDALFHLKYYVMPHYKLQRSEFAASVETLRRWFGDRRSPDYLFSHRAMFRGVPLEGLPAYLTNCWEAIRTSRDLDIPTQREMLAQHRCKEVKEQELRTFLGFARHYEDRLQRGEMLPRLSEVLDEEMETRLASFYRQTKLYHSDVVEQHASELEAELVDATMQVVHRLSKAIAAEVLANTESRALNSVEESLRQLLKTAQALPFRAGDTAAAAEASQSTQHLACAQPIDSPACQKLVRTFWRTVCSHLNEVVAEVAAMPPAAHLYSRYAAVVAQDPTARMSVVNIVTDALFQKVKSRVTSMADNACDTMHGGFERSLTHNSDGTVRFFATAAGLQKAVPAAVQAGVVVLGSLIYFRLKLVAATADEEAEGRGGAAAAAAAAGAAAQPQSRSARRVEHDRRRIVFDESEAEAAFYLSYSTLDAAPRYPYDVPVAVSGGVGDGDDGAVADCVLLSQQAALRAYELFKQKCDFTTQLQLRAIEAGNQRLPAWVIPALLVLGWNELLYVATSPALLVFIVVICVVFFKHFFVSQWHAFEETGPASVVIPAQTLLHTVHALVRPLFDAERATEPQRSAAPDREMSATAAAVAHADPVSSTAATSSSSSPATMRHRAARKLD